MGLEPRFPTRRRDGRGDDRALLARIGTPIDPTARTGRLTLAEQQLVLIARALARDCEVLILDEPTTSLTPREVERLFTLLRQLRDDGTTVIYVSHRLPEIFALTDHIEVLRDGRHVASFATPDVTGEDLVASIVGRRIEQRPPTASVERGSVVLAGRGAQRAAGRARRHDGRPRRRGGRSRRPARLGSQRAGGRAVRSDPPRRDRCASTVRRSACGHHARRSPPASGTCRPSGAARGCSPTSMPARTRWSSTSPWAAGRGCSDARPCRAAGSGRLREFDVRGSGAAKVTGLSGGNQQKVILSRWLARQPRVLLLDDPTRGVDVAAKAEIHDRLAEAAAAGTAIVMASSDLPELLRTCDRIVVLHQGRVAGELDRAEATEQRRDGARNQPARRDHRGERVMTTDTISNAPLGAAPPRPTAVSARSGSPQRAVRAVLGQREIGVIAALARALPVRHRGHRRLRHQHQPAQRRPAGIADRDHGRRHDVRDHQRRDRPERRRDLRARQHGRRASCWSTTSTG